MPQDLRHGSEPALAEVVKKYSGPNAAFLASVDGECGGCTVITAFDGTTAVLQRLYVLPHLRGCGVARLLTGAAVAFARSSGFERIVLDTDKQRLAAAYALYLSMGFTECEPYGPVEYAEPTYMQLGL